jgi:hypothetical protein
VNYCNNLVRNVNILQQNFMSFHKGKQRSRYRKEYLPALKRPSNFELDKPVVAASHQPIVEIDPKFVMQFEQDQSYKEKH